MRECGETDPTRHRWQEARGTWGRQNRRCHSRRNAPTNGRWSTAPRKFGMFIACERRKRKLLAKSQGLSSCYSTVQVRALERIREHLSSLLIKPTQRARRREHLSTLSIRAHTAWPCGASACEATGGWSTPRLVVWLYLSVAGESVKGLTEDHQLG